MLSAVFAHLVMLLFAAATATLGWYMAHNPTQALRFFTFGMEPAFGKKLGVAFCKALGYLFCAFMSAGVVFYSILIVMDILHGR